MPAEEESPLSEIKKNTALRIQNTASERGVFVPITHRLFPHWCDQTPPTAGYPAPFRSLS